ncbi:MAG: AAA family ATPase [Burkholderiales bacterium]|nr:AAA family ATPase [Burkholderiales bacterium]
MYTQFFQLNQAPFSIAPDPRYLFMSERHREALAHLLYGIGSGGGFVLLTGEIGAGKTTICRCLLEQIPANCRVAYIFNPRLTVNELLQTICDEFGIQAPVTKSAKDYFDALNAALLKSHAEGFNNVLIIDEAQNLAPEVLEQLRLLTNLETNEKKLLQIILIGQPELRSMLARPELEQLAQRVIARYHLGALSVPETAAYIQHRCAVAGCVGVSPFPSTLVPRIYALTRGVPRRINLLCDRALLGAYAGNSREITRLMIDQAAHEVFGTNPDTLRRRWQMLGASALGASVLAGAIAWATHGKPNGGSDVLLTTENASGTTIKLSRQLSDTNESRMSRLLRSFPTLGMSSSQTSESLADISRKSAALQSIATSGETVADLNGRFTLAMRDELAAFRLLGQLWGVAIKQGNACAVVKARNIHCFKGSGGIAEIRRLNRPALLTLRDEHNASYHALLIGLDQSAATLRLPGASQAQRVSLPGLGRHFKGEFTTFWRAPPGYQGKIRIGAQGEDVDWVAMQLGRLNGSIENIQGQRYSRAMSRRIRDFQASQGLKADGVAGPQTLILLNNAVGIDEPHLVADALAGMAAHRK